MTTPKLFIRAYHNKAFIAFVCTNVLQIQWIIMSALVFHINWLFDCPLFCPVILIFSIVTAFLLSLRCVCNHTLLHCLLHYFSSIILCTVKCSNVYELMAYSIVHGQSYQTKSSNPVISVQYRKCFEILHVFNYI